MDLIKIQLTNMKKGHVSTMFGLCVIRIGDSYIVGENPSIREKGVGIEEAVRKIYGK